MAEIQYFLFMLVMISGHIGTPVEAVSRQFCQRDVSIEFNYGPEYECNKGVYGTTEGYPLHLTCILNSTSPATNLTWYKNGTEQSPDYPLYQWLDYSGLYKAYLTISFTVQRADAVMLTCSAIFADNRTDCAGDLCSSCRLDVYYLDFSVSEYPSNPVREGDEVTLSCLPDANPTFSGWIEWLFGLEKSDILPMFPSYENSTSLTLPGITRDQSGWYQCFGARTDGLYWSTEYSDPVPVVVHYGAYSTDKDRTWIGTDEGDNAVLKCLIRGNPLPTVEWYNPDDVMIVSGTGRITREDNVTGDGVIGYRVSSNLTIEAVQTSTDYGTYRCTATNSIGTDEYSVLLNATAKPEPPKNLFAWGATEVSLQVTWTPGYDGGKKQVLYLNSREITQDYKTPWTALEPNVTWWFLYKLKPYTQYQISIYAENINGRSAETAINATTLPNTPEQLGIVVKYNWHEFLITGLPDDGNNETCLRLEAMTNMWYYWWRVFLDYDCVQHDVYDYWNATSVSIFRMRSRYCHGELCSLPTEAEYAYDTLVPTNVPNTNGPTDYWVPTNVPNTREPTDYWVPTDVPNTREPTGKWVPTDAHYTHNPPDYWMPDTGFVIGISIGGSVVVIAIIAVVIFMLRPRCKKSSSKYDSEGDPNVLVAATSQKDSSEVLDHVYETTLKSVEAQEMSLKDEKREDYPTKHTYPGPDANWSELEMGTNV